MKIEPVSHLLDDYQIEFILTKNDDTVRMVVIPKVLDEKMNEADKAVLQNPFVLKGEPKELDEVSHEKLTEWVSKLKEGKDNLDNIQKELDKAVEAKKTKATPKKKAPAKKAPPRKTAAQKKAEAREQQEKELTGQADLFESANRMDKEKKEPLKTAVEKASEKSMEDEVAELGI